MSGRTCLIIGANGFVGSAIQAVARRHGWDVVAIGRTNYANFVGREFDVVINANGNSRRFQANQDPLFDFEASALSVYKSLSDFRTPHYALVSTVDVYNDPSRPESTREDTQIDHVSLTPYGFHKWMAEQFVMREATNWHIFRLAQMVGCGLKKGPVYDLLHARPLWIHNESRLHFMNTQQVGEAIVGLIENGGRNEIYNICGCDSVEFRKIVELMPSSEHTTVNAAERQVYGVNVEKTRALWPLPDSWAEVKKFVEEFRRTQSPPE